MTRTSLALLTASLVVGPGLFAQEQKPLLHPADMLQPLAEDWPTYSGDYSGRRFSTLSKINESNVSSMSLAWVYRVNAGGGPFGAAIKATPILVDGVLYFTIPDHVWAIDARTGREIWHYAW